jgi:hypothetical protein
MTCPPCTHDCNEGRNCPSRVRHGTERQQERLTSSIRGHLTSAIADADWLSSEALMGQAEDDLFYLEDQVAKGYLYGSY